MAKLSHSFQIKSLALALFLCLSSSLACGQSAPLNDNFANAQPISGPAGSVDGTTANATKEAGEPNHADDPGGASVWYRWTAPTTGRVTFTTVGSIFDTVLAVYTGAAVNALTPVAANNNRLGVTSIVVFNTVAGTTYRIAVDGVRGTSSAATGPLTLTWSSQPANDNFAGAQELRGASGSVAGNTAAAGKEPGEPNHAGNAGGASVWYRWMSPATGLITFTTFGSNFDTLLAIYIGDSLTALTPVANNNDRFDRTSSVTFNAPAGTVFRIAVDGAGGDSGNLILSWTPSPPNDFFADAQTISGASGSVTGSNAGAIKEPNEPNHAGQPGGASVWYRWTAPATGSFTFTTLGSEINTLLAIYTGAAVNALATVASNDDDGRGRATSLVTFNAVAGTSYRIAVDGFAGVTGNLKLNWFATPGNDLFANAQVISGASGSVTGSNLAAFKEPNEPNHAGQPGGASVWYRWTAPSSGLIRFTTAGSSFAALVAVYTGASVGALTPVASGKTEATFSATAGTTYQIAVDGQFDPDHLMVAQVGNIALAWGAVFRPANDNFANAQLISGSTGSVTGSNVLATKEAGEPNHADDAVGVSIWYRWTAPANGSFVFTTGGSEVLTTLGVYTGASVNALTLVRADAQSGPMARSLVNFTAMMNVTYLIAVDGFDGVSLNTGALKLAWAPAPPNDLFANAQLLSGGSGSVLGNNFGAGLEPGEPQHAGATGRAGGASVWYRWTAPSSGLVSFNTFGSEFDTQLAVYTGGAVNQLTLVARNDDRLAMASGVTFTATAGITYRIAVVGVGGATGNLMLRWLPGSAPPNDNFLNAQSLPASGGRVTGSNAGASAESSEPPHAGSAANSSIWYRWTASVSSPVTFSSLGSDFTTRLAAYTGANLAALSAVANADFGQALRFNATSGTTYFIAVDGKLGTEFGSVDVGQGNLVLTFRLGGPANDNFADAQTLSGNLGSISADTLGATSEPGEPRHADAFDGGVSVWYRWTAPSAGSATFTTLGSDFDTLLAVYTGASLNALTKVASNRDFVLGTSSVTFAAAAGVTYLIAVDGSDRQTGQLTLAWQRGAPVNDDFANARTLSGLFGATGGHNADATKQPGEPAHAGNPGGRSLWYRWTAPTTGAVTFTTAASTFDTVLAVYTGGSLAALTPVVSNDDDTPRNVLTSRVSFNATAGVTYLIAVDGVAGRSGGVVLRWRVQASISGRVLIGSTPVPFAPITLTGSESRTLNADAAGFFTIANLPPGGNYTVTAYAPGKLIYEATRSFTALTGDEEEVELVLYGASFYLNISGRVTDANNNGLVGITIVLSGSASQTQKTGVIGGYKLPDLPVNGTFIVTPTSPSYRFMPLQRTLGNLAGDVIGADFKAAPSFIVSGHVMDAGGSPISGVTITLVGSEHPPQLTDADGNYFFIVPGGGTYTVMPVLANFTFTQANQTVANLSQNQKTVDFIATPVTFAINGRVTVSSSGVGGVTMMLSGAATASAATDANGRYTFTGLMPRGTYTVTPARPNFIFTPPSQSFASLSADQTADFSATPPTVTIVATDANAAEPSTDTGLFTITRSGLTNAPLTVNYTVGGTAINGTDYVAIPSAVTIAAGATTATITITPLDDTLAENGETVVLTLLASPDYLVGAPNTATVTIADDDAGPPSVRITAPADGAQFAAPANINITAEAGGGVSKVEFFANNTKLGEDPTAPYSFAWNNVAAGAYVLTARVTANQGTAVSSPVAIIVGPAVTSVSAASYARSAVASDSVVAVFGVNLAPGLLSATTVPLPTTLNGTSVKVRDSLGVERLAPLFFVSPTQVNYQMPPGTTTGAATLSVTSNNAAVGAGVAQVALTAPGLFAANATGQDVAAAVALRVKANGEQSYEAVARFDAAQGRFVAVPIDLGLAGEQVFLVLYGTGIRFRASLAAVTAKLGGADAQVLYAGAAPDFVGLDQVNVLIPRSLIGRGEVDVALTVDGKQANVLKINIK